jgi:hypothetical protein
MHEILNPGYMDRGSVSQAPSISGSKSIEKTVIKPNIWVNGNAEILAYMDSGRV